MYRFIMVRRLCSMRASMPVGTSVLGLARPRGLLAAVSASGASRYFRHRVVNHIGFVVAGLARKQAGVHAARFRSGERRSVVLDGRGRGGDQASGWCRPSRTAVSR